MAVFTAIAFAALLLEYDNLVAFNEGFGYFANNFCTFYGGSTYENFAVFVGEENAVELHGVTGLGFFAEVVNIQELAFFGFELLSLNFYDNVHVSEL